MAADDAVFTVDTGTCEVWAARYLTPNGRRRVIGSFLPLGLEYLDPKDDPRNQRRTENGDE